MYNHGKSMGNQEDSWITMRSMGNQKRSMGNHRRSIGNPWVTMGYSWVAMGNTCLTRNIHG